MKKLLSLMVAASVCFGLVACSNDKNDPGTTPETPDTETPTTEEKILYSNGGPIEFFETPWLNPGSFTYNKVLYDHLIVADQDLNPKEGQLAADYTFSEDGSSLVFNLRDDVYWHDGEKITADDVKWSIEYSLKTAVLNAVFVNTFKAISGSEAYLDGSADHLEGIIVEGNKITITFDKVAPDALLTFTQFAPLPAKYFENVDPLQIQQAAFWQAPIGSGPFKVDEVKMNDYTTLTAFDKYYKGVPGYKIQLTPSAGDSDPNFVNNAKSGLLDYGYTKNIADVKALDGTPGINITKVDVRYTRLFYLNKFTKKDGTPSPLTDVRVRQALKYAIDMKTIAESLFNGAAIPANSLTPEGASKVSGLENYDYNPEKAKQLLAEAKWDTNTVLDVVYYYTDQLTVDYMTAIQAYWAEVGVQMNFRLVEGDLASILWTAPKDQVNGPSAVDWDICYAAVAALSLHEYYDRYLTGSGANSHTPQDETLNTLIDATNASVDAKVQLDAFFELQKYENEQLFSLPLYYQPVFLVTSDKIQKGPDTIGNPQFNYDWNVQNWEISGK